MSGRLIVLASFVLAAVPVLTSRADQIAYWPLNGDAKDSVGGHGGTLVGGATFVDDAVRGTVLSTDGVNGHILVPNSPDMMFNASASYAIMAWVFVPQVPAGWHALVAKSRDQGAHYGIWICDSAQWMPGGYNNRSSAVVAQVWTHIAYVQDGAAGTGKAYLNGVVDWSGGPRDGSGAGDLWIGGAGGVTEFFNGLIDDVKIYNTALTDEEVQEAMKSGASPELADRPSPAVGAVDVPRDGGLAWKSGKFAKTHDVYLGALFDDVNSANRTDAKGVLASQGQDANGYDPTSLLAFGQTYYWRVDEVNAAPDSTLYTGKIWSFTTETYGYPLKPIKATASSSFTATMGPDKTIDGSGLNAAGQHGTSGTHMWLSKKGQSPIWMQYQFDAVYKLHQMWVWNSNQPVESISGFGAKDVTIETSQDGTTWTALANAPEFSQASGEPDYVHNTTVDFGGAQAKFVKLTITTNWADGSKQAGLSEVRFFYVPVKAFEPTPANAGTGVALNAVLNWRPGREAVKHDVYVSSDANAVAQGTVPVKTATDHAFGLGALGLEYGRTYYWKVNEVNEAAATKSWTGDLWSFTTIAYGVVDDFEPYNDVCNRVFFAWVDGFGYSGLPDCGVAASGGNGTGSTVGNTNPPFVEKTILHGGRQAMPMSFDNTKSPFYSETIREWPTAQSWTGGGANTLTVWLRGDAGAFVETSPGTVIMNGKGADIWANADQFRLAFKSLKGNGSVVARVDGVANTDGWAKAGVMIRESADPASPHAMVVVTPSNSVSFQRRDVTGDVSGSTDVPGGLKAPYWVKLTRNGNAFTGQCSPDGVAWMDITVTPAVTITMANDVLIGLAVTSHNATAVCGARFSNVSTTGSVSGQWQTADIGVPQVNGNSPETFYVAVQDSAGKLKVVSNPDKTIIATGVWQQWDMPLSQFTSAGLNLGAIKKMSIGVGDRSAPKAGSAGKLYIDDIRLTRVATP